jgi:hypothetical protein
MCIPIGVNIHGITGGSIICYKTKLNHSLVIYYNIEEVQDHPTTAVMM